MYTQKEIERILQVVRDARLEVPQAMREASIDELGDVCNGVGADWMSERSRAIVTKVMSYAEASAAIHDWQYDAQDVSQEIADETFLINGLREVRFKYPNWWNWRRWLGERAVLAAYEVLSRTGKVAWALSFYNKMKGKAGVLTP